MCEHMLRKVWFGKGSDGGSHGKSYRKSIPGREKGNAGAESRGEQKSVWLEKSGGRAVDRRREWQGSFGLWRDFGCCVRLEASGGI